ncbi:MFS transporter [Jatrophihabitans lederbergiae]|uniref:MFS transporter n=1 Tax=Jatrophihabitans lederbergiae TaxID=3075547 RepID=A0ABU2J9U0_9ACTN|nr:MFS transporter [Jatrophihabitans sp. DSM 44399]MDT0261747.1 MFS transporter [Jatrophihabitans sp. DSM 44399]
MDRVDGVSSLGDGIRFVAFPLLAAALTRDPRAVALVSAAGFLPWPLFGLLGGAVVDRVDRRRLMWRTDVLRAIVVGCFALLVASNRAPVAGLAAVSFVLGVAETFFDNAASALVPMLVADPVIERANSWLLSSQTVMSVLVGGPRRRRPVRVCHRAARGLHRRELRCRRRAGGGRGWRLFSETDRLPAARDLALG